MNAAVFGSKNDGIVTLPCDMRDERCDEDSGPSDGMKGPTNQEITDFVKEDVHADETSISVCVCVCVFVCLYV